MKTLLVNRRSWTAFLILQVADFLAWLIEKLVDRKSDPARMASPRLPLAAVAWKLARFRLSLYSSYLCGRGALDGT
jgi:hypothetical protein